MKTLGERIRLIMDESGLGVTEIAAIAGIKPPSVSDWLNGKTKTLKAGPALRLSKHFKVNSLWLTEDTGPMREQPNTSKKQDSSVGSEPPIVTLKPTTERELWMRDLNTLADQLDTVRLGMLIGKARDLVAEQPAKQTLKSSV